MSRALSNFSSSQQIAAPKSPTTLGLGLFAYGSLTIPAVMQVPLDRVPASTVTRCPGWRAAGLRGRPYPGLVRDAEGGPGAPGRLHMDLTETEWLLLAAFKSAKLLLTIVELADGSRALVYAWPVHETVLEENWTARDMEGDVLERYMDNARSWRLKWEQRADEEQINLGDEVESPHGGLG